MRLLPSRGNAGSRLSLVLTNVPGGNLYGSVQAVDASFAGSAFSPESTITLPNSAPVAAGASVTLPENTQKTIVLSASDPDGDRLLYSVTQPPAFGTLTGNPPYVVYRPRLNYFGLDQFTFVISDRATNSQPATVFITIQPAISLTTRSNDLFTLRIQGEPGRNYQLETSTNLVTWTTQQNILLTNSPFLWSDPDSSSNETRFYRLRFPQ
jgi:hypothetical protein